MQNAQIYLTVLSTSSSHAVLSLIGGDEKAIVRCAFMLEARCVFVVLLPILRTSWIEVLGSIWLPVPSIATTLVLV